VAFPDARHIACASVDNIRLWNVAENAEDIWSKPKSAVPFKIIPGHHGAYISQMLIDSGARFLVSASSNRGLHGDSTKTVFVHDIKRIE
jgi:transcriptional activator SPT8